MQMIRGSRYRSKQKVELCQKHITVWEEAEVAKVCLTQLKTFSLGDLCYELLPWTKCSGSRKKKRRLCIPFLHVRPWSCSRKRKANKTIF